MKSFIRFASTVMILSMMIPVLVAQPGQEIFHTWAPSPPMGWNSWDCFGPTVVEDEVKANADYMARHLKKYGWQYIVVDIRWYVANDKAHGYNQTDPLYSMDACGRFIPAPNRFPSAADGKGFKPLADYVHRRGLKFGIHIMRGIPRLAVERNTPIAGSDAHARDIYSDILPCSWLGDMYTVIGGREGSQEYYNSLFDLYASWGVDFVKVDDLSAPYHAEEIEMIRRAIDQCGRPVVLSTSPGETPVAQAEHIRAHANMWRIMGDFWDNWPQLKLQFTVCPRWIPWRIPGAWPDADMLPLGHIGIRAERGDDRMSAFTRDEQQTLMTLFSIFRSPLMFGGHLPDNDEYTLSLITNKEVLEVHRNSTGNREWFNANGIVAWMADEPQTGDKYLALFNIQDQEQIVEGKALWNSGLICSQTTGYTSCTDLDIGNARRLYLVVSDAGDGIDWDHADWINPVIFNDSDTLSLAALGWKHASAGWGRVTRNGSVSGNKLIVNNKPYDTGIGTHSSSVIEFEIPAGYTRFASMVGLDRAAAISQAGATVKFMVFTDDPAGPVPDDSAAVTIPLKELGFDGKCLVRDLWKHQNRGIVRDTFTVILKRHASVLYRITDR